MAGKLPALKPKYRKLAKRELSPDCHDLGKADNLLRQMRYGLGFDPLAELVGIYQHPDTTMSERIRIATELMSYVAPKMKAIAAPADTGDVININVSYPEEQAAQKFAKTLSLEMGTKEN